MLSERLRIIFTKFRLADTKLPSETGRWFNIYRNERYCILCNRNKIGDEFNLLLQCDTLGDQRHILLITLILSSSLCCLIFIV